MRRSPEVTFLVVAQRRRHLVTVNQLSRLVSLVNGQVTFCYRETDTGQLRLRTLSAEEFIHRFLQHVLPKGFVKVRYFGFFAPVCRKRLAALRQQLEQKYQKSLREAEASLEPADSDPHPQFCCQAADNLCFFSAPFNQQDAAYHELLCAYAFLDAGFHASPMFSLVSHQEIFTRIAFPPNFWLSTIVFIGVELTITRLQGASFRHSREP